MFARLFVSEELHSEVLVDVALSDQVSRQTAHILPLEVAVEERFNFRLVDGFPVCGADLLHHNEEAHAAAVGESGTRLEDHLLA